MQSIPKGQHWLVERMQALGYPAEYEGVCFGVANMTMQAILANDLATFNERLHLLNRIPPNELDKKINAVKDKIKLLAKEEIETSLTQEERLLISIPAFMDGVILYQYPEKFPDFFERKQITQSTRVVAPIVQPEKLGGKIEEIPFLSFISAHNIATLNRYLNGLAAALTNCKVPVAFILSSENHAITISFDPQIKIWTFTDANNLSTNFNKPEEMATAIINAFSTNQKAVFKTCIFSEDVNQKELNLMLSEWANKEKNDKSAYKMSIIDSRNRTWLRAATLETNLEEVNKLLLAGADPTFYTEHKKPEYAGTPIHYAVRRKYTDMVEAMVTNILSDRDANPDLLNAMITAQTAVLMKSTPEEITSNINSLVSAKPKITVRKAIQSDTNNEISRLIQTNEHDADDKIKVLNEFINTINDPKNSDKYILDIYHIWKNSEAILGKKNIDVLQPGEAKISFFKQTKNDSYLTLENILNQYGDKKPQNSMTSKDIRSLFEKSFIELYAQKLLSNELERQRFKAPWYGKDISRFIKMQENSMNVDKISQISEIVAEVLLLKTFKQNDPELIRNSLKDSPLSKYVNEIYGADVTKKQETHFHP